MKVLLLIFATVLAALTAGSVAAQPLPAYVTPPPLVLSPDLGAPWVQQLMPATGGLIELPAPPKDAVVAPAPAVPGLQTLAPAVSAPPAASAQAGMDPRFLPTVVPYDGPEPAGTIVIDTHAFYLYLVEPNGQARRYGVGVGREGFAWSGTETITRKAEWPAWYPPAEMRRRQPELPTMMPGGPDNPLGARALYLGDTLYRIHGSNAPWTIGHAVSSGCIRMRNEDVIDLYGRVSVGTIVIVR